MNVEDLSSYGFIKLYESVIELHSDIEDNNVFVYLIDNKTYYIYDINHLYTNGELKQRFVYDTTIPKTVCSVEYLSFTKYYSDSVLYPFLTYNNQYKFDPSIRNLISCQLEDITGSNRVNYYTQLEKRDGNYYIVSYANDKILQRILSNKKSDYKTNMFIDILYYKLKNDVTKECEHEMTKILHKTPSDTYNIEELDKFLNNYLKDDINLFAYQKNDIAWMNKIKNDVDNQTNTINLDYSIFYNVVLNGNNYFLYNRTLIPNLSNETTKKSNLVKYYGGNIISEVGLGKSLIVLSHILYNSVNEYDKFIEFKNDTCNYFYKRGKNKGGNCHKKKVSDLYCKEHSDTLFIDKRSTTYKDMDDFKLRDYIKDIDGVSYFKTNANLILCPNQLCDQWVREYYDKFKQDSDVAKRILLIVTYDQYKNLTLGDILTADVIIVSYNFLINPNYCKKIYTNSYYDRYNRVVIKKRKNIVDILDELDGDENINSIEDLLNVHHDELNILHNFQYQGVYLDENHEIINKPRSELVIELIEAFQSTYKWNITATPFPNSINSFIKNINYITNTKLTTDVYTDWGMNIYSYDKKIIQDFSELYRRNTKESVMKEFAGNIITENVKLLDFTEQERTIYDAHLQGNRKTNRDFLIKLCCDTSIDVETRKLVKNCKTLDEIQNVMLAHNKSLLKKLSNEMEEHKKRVEFLTTVVNRGFILDETDDDGVIFETIEEVKSEIGIHRRKITNSKKEYDNIHRTYTYLKNAIENIKENETCPICLDDIQSDQIAITKCGHKFCKDCINEYIEEFNHYDVKCPKCNVEISVKDIYLLEEVKEIECKKVDNSDLNELIQKVKSTKIGNIIYYLKHEMTEKDKCIIFSQWDTMLTKIGSILKQEGIDVLYCTGTVYQRKRAINKFQNDPQSNIIFLSSENCASGINLTSANKILLIEPIYGSKEYRKDIENQAIGRADRIGQKRPIEIVRFIIKNSIEEEIFTENNKTDNIESEEVLVV